MNTPFTMVVKETKNKIINACNESGLSFAVLDLILERVYSEVHSLAERQAAEDEMSYAKMVAEASKVADEDSKATEVADTNID